MNEDWLSAHLDGELSESETTELEAALATDAALAETYADLARVRSVLRAGAVEPQPGSLERILAFVEEADDSDEAEREPAPVVHLSRRRRVPTFAAVAASLIIIAGVVGGVGGPESLPAIGDLIAQHQAAAAVVEGAPMPDDMADAEMDDMVMDDSPAMPADFSMRHAFVVGSTVQLVYLTDDGEAVSVFRHAGDTDVDEFGGGSIVRGDDGDMWSAQRADAYVAVVDGEGYVWVVISEQPHESMMASMMNDLPTRSRSIGNRLRETADAVVEPFRFWN